MRVTRLLATGDVIEYEARLDLEIDDQGHVGRALLERIKFLHACARIGAYEMFRAALDLPLAGHRNWWTISNIPVEISRHTSEIKMGKTYTRAVMDNSRFATA